MKDETKDGNEKEEVQDGYGMWDARHSAAPLGAIIIVFSCLDGEHCTLCCTRSTPWNGPFACIRFKLIKTVCPPAVTLFMSAQIESSSVVN